MGVAVMKLYMVEVPADGRRWFFKNPTEAKRQQKSLKPTVSTRSEFVVTLTKDGVLEALNRVPFRKRAPGATARVEPAVEDALPAAPVASRPALVPRSRHLYRVDPEDRVALTGKNPEYVRGWNMVKQKRKFG